MTPKGRRPVFTGGVFVTVEIVSLKYNMIEVKLISLVILAVVKKATQISETKIIVITA